MSRVLIPLAPGFEELEAVTLVDLLRRAGIEVVTAGLQRGPVTASRGTVIQPDTTLDQVACERFDLIALPGGLPGADNLAGDPVLGEMLREQHLRRDLIGAICAAPRALARHGILDGRRVSAFPGALEGLNMPETTVLNQAVVVDGHVVTSRGPGTAMDFALKLIEMLEGEAISNRVEAGLQRQT